MKPRRAGKYEILEDLGRGGFGTVYRARDTILAREVALKVMHPQLLVDPSFLARFQQEARIAAKLKHPHIVVIHELGETEGVWYLAMELLEGRPLDCVIADEGPLNPEQALGIIRDIGVALDYAHQRGLIHRDVKPSNIIVDDAGHATLTDFGLVRAALSSTLSTTMGLIGTPTYMSPEQCEGEELDGRSDLYALGVVLYEMLTGRVPFQADTPLAVMRGHADKAPPPPCELNPELSEPVEAVLLKALAKGREERYANGARLAEALEQAVQARDAAAAREAMPGPPAQAQAPAKAEAAPVRAESRAAPGRRVPGWIWPALGTAGVLLIAVAVALVLLLGGGPDAAETPTPEPTQVVAVAPPATDTPPPTRTSTPTHTNTPTPTRTNTPTHTNTPTPTRTSTPTPSFTLTPTRTSTPMPYSYRNAEGGPDCVSTWVWGYVLGADGLPEANVQIRMGDEHGWKTDTWTNAQGYYAYKLFEGPIARRWFVQVFTGGLPRSERFGWKTSATCEGPNALQQVRIDWVHR